jgi:hypothetical protein
MNVKLVESLSFEELTKNQKDYRFIPNLMLVPYP